MADAPNERLRPAAAFAFGAAAARLRRAGIRLQALDERLQQRLDDALQALDMLPAAALADPFGSATSATAAADAKVDTAGTAIGRLLHDIAADAARHFGTERPRRDATAPQPLLRQPAAGPTAGPAAARPLPTPAHETGTGGARGRDAVALPQRRAAARSDTAPRDRASAPPRTNANLARPPAVALPAAARSPMAPPAQSLGTLVSDVSSGAAGSIPDVATPALPHALPAVEVLARQLRALAAAPAHRAPPSTQLHAAIAAPRAPSLLAPPAGGRASAGDPPAAAPGTAPARSRAGAGAGADDDNDSDRDDAALAAIQRLLLDQAWLRGVDLR